MTLAFQGRVQDGKGDASRWLTLFNAAYARKIGALVFPGSLNNASSRSFDCFAPEIQSRALLFERSDPWVVVLIASRGLRETFQLVNAAVVEIELDEHTFEGEST